MASRLVIMRSAFEEVLARLVRDASAIAACPVGTAHSPGLRTYLAREARWIPREVRAADDLLVVRRAPTSGEISRAVSREAGRFPPRGEGAVLCVAFENQRIAMGGVVVCGEQPSPLERLSVIGPGMPEVRFGEAVAATGLPPPPGDGQWSRTIGALGERTWRRITDLSFAIIGAGRAGSLVATSLGRLGVRNIALVDPDELEPHSFAEGDFAASTVSIGKADAVREYVHSLPHAGGLRILSLGESVHALPALAVIKSADVLICCVDNAEARYATALLAKAYLKPLLDIGTGVLNGQDRPMGADIRLVLPNRCLQCFGGIAGLGAEPAGGAADWRTQRAGSLRSLNQIAVGFAMRMLEDFVAGRLGEAWTQLDFAPNGRPDVRSIDPASSQCELCAGIGMGGDGFLSTHGR